MLAGAIVIIVQAPRCKPIPEMNWWNEGPIYQISDVEAFSDGLEGKITLICEKKTLPHMLACPVFYFVTMSSSFLMKKNSYLVFARQPDWCGNIVLSRVKVP